MNLSSCTKDELSSLDHLHIYEQALDIVLNPRFSIFHSKNDCYVIIGYESDHTFYNRGKLLCGIVAIKKEILDDRVVYLEKSILPFSSKILFAKFDLNDHQVNVAFCSLDGIKKQLLDIKDGNLFIEDLNDLLDENYPVIEFTKKFHVSCEVELPLMQK